MQWLWDDQGDRYLDLFGGIVTVSVGHCHPKVCLFCLIWGLGSLAILHTYKEACAVIPNDTKAS